jgi:DNA-binding SARP family transcriptional activator
VSTTSQLRIAMLGELAASYDDRPLDLGGPRQRAVLALLLLARGEVVAAERIADSLWGDHPPAGAAGALQSYVSHLRRRLQPGTPARERSAVIVSEGKGYAVRLPTVAVDAWRFEELVHLADATDDPQRACALLREALELWRGPALADYADEPWAEAEVARLTELRTVSRERLLAARLELGEGPLLVPELEAMVAEEPLREERWRLLVVALYRAHRQADALGALRRARATLVDELGIDPGPALRALEADVLAQSPSLDVPRQRASQPSAAAAGPSPAPDLADRDTELAAIHAALDDLARGQPGLLLVEGPAGIGKSRLLAEVRRLAADRSLQVRSARGSQLEQAFGFGMVRQLFEPVLASADRRDDLLAGAAAGASGVFDLHSDGALDGSFAVMHALHALTANLAAAAPVTLAIDDLQWSDGESLRYLAYLVRRLDAVPVLVAATVRAGERNEHDDLLTELLVEPAAVVIRPAPLSEEATARIVAERLGPASPLFTAACHRMTAGNPLLLRQLLRGLEADGVRPDAAHADRAVAVGSRAVSNMVLLRLRRMPPVATAVARAAAVLGDGATLRAVASLAEVSAEDAAAALSALARAEVVTDEMPIAFVHPLVREAVYRDLSAAERQVQHGRAAEVLAATGAAPEQVAAHLLLAPDATDPQVLEALRSAARTGTGGVASGRALTYLQRALEQGSAGTGRSDVLGGRK